MAYDAARQRVDLVGGYSHSDMWEWDGSAWSKRMPVTSPPADYLTAPMAYDEARQRLTLVSGSTTWVFLP